MPLQFYSVHKILSDVPVSLGVFSRPDPRVRFSPEQRPPALGQLFAALDVHVTQPSSETRSEDVDINFSFKEEWAAAIQDVL